MSIRTIPTIYTIGHSNRTLAEFLALLQQNAIQILVDIRATPYSKRFPHYSQDILRQTMNSNDIVYYWAGRQLGGQRQVQNPSSHPALENDNLRGFAEYMESVDFEHAIVQLVNLAGTGRTAIMCAEKLVEHCHRALISDYLTLKNIHVVHIIDSTREKDHVMSRFARTESTRLIYDRYINSQLDLY